MKSVFKIKCCLMIFVIGYISSPWIVYADISKIENNGIKHYLKKNVIENVNDFDWKEHFGSDKAESAKSIFLNKKIIVPSAILNDFAERKIKSRVIVTLKPPSGILQTEMMKDDKSRKKQRLAVKNLLNTVISRMDAKEVKSKNRFQYIYGFSAEVTLKGLEQLTKDPDVLSIEKDEILYAHVSQGISLMNALSARSLYAGDGLSIAICDTGIDYNHPKLGGGVFPNSKVIGGYDCGDDDIDPIDQQGHGTACAGIAAGDVDKIGDYIGGVAHKARLYAVKIATGAGGSAYSSDMIEGWEWCITHQNDDPQNPIMIISTSFGGGRYYNSCDNESPSMAQAATNAANAGITIFVSSGNDGYCDSVGWPSCISNVISVGAVYDAGFGNVSFCVSGNSCNKKYPTDQCTSGWYATDSTQADLVTSYSNTASILGLLAPSNQASTTDITGSNGYSGGDYTNSFGGTSAACPYAAGAAACLQNAAKELTGSFLSPSQIRSILTTTGDPITDQKVAITKSRVNLQVAINYLTGPPIAEFTTGLREICIENNTATFTDSSLRNPVFRQWTFSPDTVTYVNGTNSNSQNPVVQFQSSGDYTISLYVENTFGNDTVIKTDFIAVHDICQEFQLDLTTDDYGSETSWSIKSSENEILYSGGPYSSNQTYRTAFLLPAGDYAFSIFDSWGDGICCSYGSGGYILSNTDREKSIVSGGAFAFEEITNFSVVSLSDYNEDGDIDGSDLSIFSAAFANSLFPKADINSDDIIDIEDLRSFAADYGD